MKKIVDEVLRRIVPSPEEEKALHRVVGRLKARIDEKKPHDVDSMLVGSVAKGTYLRDALDIDFSFSSHLNTEGNSLQISPPPSANRYWSSG